MTKLLLFGLMILVVLVNGCQETFDTSVEDPCTNIEEDALVLSGDVFIHAKPLCYVEKAKETGDVRICDFLKNTKDSCISNVAHEKKDIELCNQITDEKWKQSCEERLTKQ